MHRLGILLVALAVALPAAADDVVHLKSGEVLAGKTADGLLEVLVETPDGPVRVPWSRIDRIERGSFLAAEYEKRAAEVSAGDAEARFLLALWCRRQGLAEPMKRELQRVLDIDPDHAGARSALGYEKVEDEWRAGAELAEAKGFVRRDGKWILLEEARYADLVAAREQKLSEPEEKAGDLVVKCADENPRVAKYARTTLLAMRFEDVRLPLYRALGDRRPAVRTAAAEALGTWRMPETARPLLRTAILDVEGAPRAAAVASLAALGDPGVLFPMARALNSEYPEVRTNAAQAVGALGDVRGIEILVTQLGQSFGTSSRVNFQSMRQVSYIQDFDVEIAQAAQIGDPIVGVLREGIILDFQMLGGNRTIDLVERRAIRSALVRLSGEDFGDDAGAWAKWWKENGERLTAAR